MVKVAKHPPNPPRRQSIRSKQSPPITNTTAVAKHLPEQNCGRVFTSDGRAAKHLLNSNQSNPDDAEQRAKVSAEAKAI